MDEIDRQSSRSFTERFIVLGTSAINVTSTSSGTVTSVITTGPDGTSLDEGSQQSTLSNASAGQYMMLDTRYSSFYGKRINLF